VRAEDKRKKAKKKKETANLPKEKHPTGKKKIRK
jgi:hypothetical protein